MERIGEFIIELNSTHPSSEWPDMVVVLTQGTVNYVVSFPGEPIKGDFLLPNVAYPYVAPMYINVLARGLGLFSINRMCAFMFLHLGTFFPGANLPKADEVLEGVSELGLTLGTYQFNLRNQLVPVSFDLYAKQSILAPLPFRIEDHKGNLLSRVQFVPWQGGGLVRLIGKLSLEEILIFLGSEAKNAKIIKQPDGHYH
jgi:hypothetical protein